MVSNVLGNTIIVSVEFLGKSESVDISPTGKVLHWIPVLLTLFCPMRMELFPFDTQFCPIVLAPWSYDSSQLQLWPNEKDVATVGKFEWDVSKKWIIQDFTGQRGVLHDPNNNRSYDQMNFWISLKRKSTFYVLNLLLPCYLISLIACLCYVIPPQGGDRINLLMTTFLSIVVFVLVVLEIVPEESDTLPLFSKFLLGVMLLNMFQIIYCTIVCGLNNVDQICIGPPRCLVIWAKCMTTSMTSSCSRKHKTLASKETYQNQSLQNRNTEHIQDGLEKQINFEIKLLNDNEKNDSEKKCIPERNIKEWRILFKSVDALMFILTFLGLSGYFFGILLIHYVEK